MVKSFWGTIKSQIYDVILTNPNFLFYFFIPDKNTRVLDNISSVTKGLHVSVSAVSMQNISKGYKATLIKAKVVK